MSVAKVDAPTEEETFTGLVRNFGFLCKPLGATLMNNNGWALVSYSHKGNNTVISGYLLDRSTQVFGNIFSKKERQPVLINGTNKNVNSGTDTLRIDSRNVIGQNRYMETDLMNMTYSVENLIFGISVVMTVNFTALPTSAFEKIIILESNKRITLHINQTGNFRVTLNSANEFWTPSTSLIVLPNEEYVIKLYAGKVLVDGLSGVLSLSINQINSVAESPVEEGTFINCIEFFFNFLF